MWRMWNWIPCKTKRDRWKWPRGGVAPCGMRETRWTLARKQGIRLRLRGFQEMGLIPPGSNPGARFAVVVGATTLLAPVPLAHPSPGSSFGGNCRQSQAPIVDRTQYEELTWDQLHEQCA